MRARDAAQRILARESTGNRPRPRPVTLTAMLAQPDPVIDYRIGLVWPSNGSVVLAAPKKAGKSTLIANLIRALADGEPFLGAYLVTPVKQLTLIDNEHDGNTLRRWLRSQGIVNTDAVQVVTLRGNVTAFDILDPVVNAEWAAELRGADIVILDCLRPVLDALGLDENRDAGRFLVAFEELCARAGASECLVVHHMGHQDGRGGERSRGDSRIRDWPYAEWKLLQEPTPDGKPEDPSRPRYFAAYGRDVDVPEARLTYNSETRRLTRFGGTRRAEEWQRARTALLEFVKANPGQGANELDSAMHEEYGVGQKLARTMRGHLIREKLIRSESGSNRRQLHYIVPEGATANKEATP